MKITGYNNRNAQKSVLGISLVLIFLACAFAGPGGEFWERKKYRQWSQKECAKLLENSPWAKPYQLTAVGIMNNSDRQGASDLSQPYVNYYAQFRSALPVREAIVRQNQIAMKYDSLTPQEQQAFDKTSEAFLSGFPPDTVVVAITYSTNNRIWDMNLARYWQAQTVDVFKNSVYLYGSKGEKAAAVQYLAGQGEQRSFEFTFPRVLNGKPILDPKDKSLNLEFTYPVFQGVGDGKIFMEFKVEKMIFEGEIAY